MLKPVTINTKCFPWCHIRIETHLERITESDKNMINDLDYCNNFDNYFQKGCCKIEQINNICINVFCCENSLVCPIYLSNLKFEDCMDLLFITDENKSHYVCIKDYNRNMCKSKCRTKFD